MKSEGLWVGFQRRGMTGLRRTQLNPTAHTDIIEYLEQRFGARSSQDQLITFIGGLEHFLATQPFAELFPRALLVFGQGFLQPLLVFGQFPLVIIVGPVVSGGKEGIMAEDFQEKGLLALAEKEGKNVAFGLNKLHETAPRINEP